jgi:hypothetical protein
LHYFINYYILIIVQHISKTILLKTLLFYPARLYSRVIYWRIYYQLIFAVLFGYGMSVYYQVCPYYQFCGSKAKLLHITLYTAPGFHSYYNSSPVSCLHHPVSFHTLPQAQGYINYLVSRHPNTPVISKLVKCVQPLLF